MAHSLCLPVLVPLLALAASTSTACNPQDGDQDTGNPSASTAEGTAPDTGRHYGTRHVASRLATLYGSQASYQLQPAPDADGGTLAEVRLPLQTNPLPA